MQASYDIKKKRSKGCLFTLRNNYW